MSQVSRERVIKVYDPLYRYLENPEACRKDENVADMGKEIRSRIRNISGEL